MQHSKPCGHSAETIFEHILHYYIKTLEDMGWFEYKGQADEHLYWTNRTYTCILYTKPLQVLSIGEMSPILAR